MFVAATLAARIELVEARLSLAVARAVQADRAISSYITELGGGAAVFSRPGSPVNKLIGLGFAGPLGSLDMDALAAIEAAWHARCEPVRVELASLADPAVAEQLAARGYRVRGFEHVLARPLDRSDAAREPPPDITISEHDHDTDWLPTLTAGFAVPDGSAVTLDPLGQEALEAIMHDFAAASGFRRYTARIAGNLLAPPVGAAALRIDDGVALLCGAATLPPARRRGVQAAFLATRLRDASRAGCELAVVTTEPGSLSQKNIARQGFELAYVRAIVTLPPP